MNTAFICLAGTTLAGLRYLIGVDGGGTGTRVRLADTAGRLLGQGEAGPSALIQGSEQAWRHIGEAIAQAAAQAGVTLDPSQCGIGLGLSGAGVPAFAEAFLNSQPGYAALAFNNDGWTTLLGAHGGAPGAVVAAGTGVVGEVLRADGSSAVISGWGWITGDEGSGAWLGLKAVGHAQEAFDGRAAGGSLAAAVLAVTGASRAEINAWNAASGQARFASLAPLVFEHAERGDAVAAGFVAEAVAELEKMAHALDPSGALPLALTGSIALRLVPRFSAAVRARCVTPQGDSAAGGLHLIRNALLTRG